MLSEVFPTCLFEDPIPVPGIVQTHLFFLMQSRIVIFLYISYHTFVKDTLIHSKHMAK